MQQKISQQMLDELIMVEKPYNILQDLKLNDDGSVEAKVLNEYSHEDEGGPIAGGEFGRHIAILGSIALAIEFDHKHRHYYLAIHADLKRRNSRVYKQDELKLKAKTISKKKRKGKIYGEIFNHNGEVIFTAEVEYMVLSQSVFSKLYGRHEKHTIIENKFSPYKNRKNLSHVTVNGIEARGKYGRIMHEECEGHFRNYHALPVAILGGLFGELGFHLFKHNIPGFDKVVSPRTIIKAHGLAFSGEKVYFVGRISNRISESKIIISAEAMVRDEVVSNIEFELQGVNVE